jgi:hypothetical protein
MKAKPSPFPLSLSVVLISIGLFLFSDSLYRMSSNYGRKQTGGEEENVKATSSLQERGSEGGQDRTGCDGKSNEEKKDEDERENLNKRLDEKAVDEERGKKRPTVVVVGGGLAGLSASIESERAGCHVILIDKESALGGNSGKASSGINGCGTTAQVNRRSPSGSSISYRFVS